MWVSHNKPCGIVTLSSRRVCVCVRERERERKREQRDESGVACCKYVSREQRAAEISSLKCTV